MQRKASLTSGSIPKHLWQLSLPAIVALFCNFSFLLVDMYFISRLGHQELMAISYVLPVGDFYIGAALGIGIGVSSVAARLIGAENFTQVKCYVLHTAILCILIALGLMVFGIATITPLFSLLGAKMATMPYIKSFMTVWYLGSFFLLFNMIAHFALRADGKPQGTAAIQVLSAFLNLALDPVLIFWCKFGIMGAALAGFIARFIAMLLLLRLLLKHDLISRQLKKVRWPELVHSWRTLMSIAIPAAITNAIGPLAKIWTTFLLARIMQSAVAGYGIASQIQLMVVLPLFAVSGSVGPIVGQNFSAEQAERSWQAVRQTSMFAIIWGSVIAVLLWLLAPAIVRVFSIEPTTVTVAVEYLTIVPISYVAWGVIMMVNANFNALGYPRRSALISFLRMIVLFIPLSFLLQHVDGYRGIFWAFSISTLLVAGFAYAWARQFYQTTGVSFSAAAGKHQ